MTEAILTHLEDPKFSEDLISKVKKGYNNLPENKRKNCDKILTFGGLGLVLVVFGYIIIN